MGDDRQIQRFEPSPRSLERRAKAQPVPYDTIGMRERPDLLEYWRIIQKRRWTVLTIFLSVFTIVLIGTLRQVPIYEGKALLEIEKESANTMTVQELFDIESVSYTYLETQYKILESESLARRVIDTLNLGQREEFKPSEPWFGGSERDESERDTQVFSVEGAGVRRDAVGYQDTLEEFQDRLAIEPVKNSRLVEVRFESESSALAAQVVNTLANMYIEQNLEARWEATQKASEWLSRQLLTLKAKLEKSEAELQQYARENGLLFLTTESGKLENVIDEKLRQLQEELIRAQTGRYQKEALYTLVQAGEYDSLPTIADNSLMQDLTVALADLKRQHAALSTTFTPEYFKVKQLQNQIDEIEAVLARERQRAAHRIRNDYAAAVERENLLGKAYGQAREQANLVAELSVHHNILKREVDTNRQLYKGLLQRLKEAGVSAGLRASNIRIVDAAVAPEYPVKPRVLLNLFLAVFFGLGMGVGTAFLQEYLDNTLKATEDVERFVGVPSLAVIPSAESLNGRSGVYGLYGRRKLLTGEDKSGGTTGVRVDSAPEWHRIDSGPHGTGLLGEAFRSLRTSVLLSTAEHPPRSLVVSSSQPGEGKTTVSINLSISLAQLGRRVMLVEGDLRRPCLHRAFRITDSPGVVSYLIGQEEWKEVSRPTSVPGLDVIVCGPVPPNPAELISCEPMRVLLREVEREYDFVVLDSPPLLNVADARILASLVEGMVLVVKGGSTPRDLVQRARASAADAGANVIGVVLNNLDTRFNDYYYSRYYRHDYGPGQGAG
jgi:capsular exopolysaccharide synthesis family protein